MREAEEQMLDAEKWASLAWVLAGRAYPSSDLTEDWKKVLFNQFHDTAAGSGIGVIYKDAQKDYDVVRWSTNEIDAGALGTVAEKIDTRVKREKSTPIVVFNPLGWERSGDVKVKLQLADPKQEIGISQLCKPEGSMNQIDPTILSRDPDTGIIEVSFRAPAIPALGYKAFRLGPPWHPKPGEPTPGCVHGHIYMPQEPNGKDYILGSGWITARINRQTGCITSIRNDKTKYEWIAKGACGNELQAFKDTPTQYDAWNIDPGTLDQTPTLIQADKVEFIGEKDPTPSVRVTRHWQNSTFVQTISLKEGSDQIDIDNEIDWHESHVLLKAAFPLAASGPFATYEIPYGTIDRPTTRNNSWEKAQFEVTALRWADLSGPGPDGKVHGLSILNQNKYGYDAAGNVLRLTLLRSPKWPDAEADMGHHHFHYALYPHAGTWKEALTVRHGYEYNYPLTAVVTTAHPGSLPASHSFASVSPENVVLTAVKKAEDQNGLGVNGLILRVYEWAGKETTAEFHVPPGATGATVTSLMETPEGSPLPVTGDVVKAPIHPYEILTIRVDYPNAGPKP
jgi:alpha-mannosidase